MTTSQSAGKVGREAISGYDHRCVAKCKWTSISDSLRAVLISLIDIWLCLNDDFYWPTLVQLDFMSLSRQMLVFVEVPFCSWFSIITYVGTYIPVGLAVATLLMRQWKNKIDKFSAEPTDYGNWLAKCCFFFNEIMLLVLNKGSSPKKVVIHTYI